MKPTKKWLTLFRRIGLFVLIPISIALLVISCQRTIEPMTASKDFDDAAAKEWYYGIFKKSAEWASSSEHGKKLPDWKHGFYRKIGGMEIVEFPLKTSVKSVTLLGCGGLTDADKKRLGSSSLTRIAFIKKSNGEIVVREVDYIPDWNYLNMKKFDISSVCMGKPDNDFSGKLRVKQWNGKYLQGWIVKDGKVIRKMQEIKADTKTAKQSVVARVNDICYEESCVYRTVCTWAIVGDQLVDLQCNEVELFCDVIPYYCNNNNDEPEPCAGLSTEVCNCILYEIGCSSNGDDDEPCDATALNAAIQEFNDYTEIAPTLAVTKNASTTSVSSDPITGSFSWTVLKALVAGWEIRSNCDYKYWHTVWMTTNYQIEHHYDLFSFHSGNGYYVGSNSLIKSTYTTTTPTTNNVFNNDTQNTRGESHVRGVIKHESKLKIRFPGCDPVDLNTENAVDNYLYFYPQ